MRGCVVRRAGRAATSGAVAAALWCVLGTVGMAAGRTPAIAPVRIVSTAPSVTEVLFALGLGDKVVGVSSYCRFPDAVKALPKIGTFLRPNAELMARLRPDLAIVGSSSDATRRQLAALGIRSLSVTHAQTLADVYAMIHVLGHTAGVDRRADALAGLIADRLDRIHTDARTRPRRKVLLVVGRSPGTLTDLVAVGHGSYLDELVTIAGGTNVLGDPRLPAYPRIAMESVIRLDPDVIVDAGDMGDTVAEHVRRQATTEGLWRQHTLLAAVRTGAVHAVTSDAFVVPGPRVVEAAETLAGWIRAAGTR